MLGFISQRVEETGQQFSVVDVGWEMAGLLENYGSMKTVVMQWVLMVLMQ